MWRPRGEGRRKQSLTSPQMEAVFLLFLCNQTSSLLALSPSFSSIVSRVRVPPTPHTQLLPPCPLACSHPLLLCPHPTRSSLH